MEPVSFCVVGVGGYGRMHIRIIEALEEEGLAKLSAAVVRNPKKYSDEVSRLRRKNVRIYRSYMDMLENEAGTIEIVTLPVAIHQHKDMTITALKAGFNVLVEKPPAVTIQDLDAMIEAERASSGFCAVGFQSQSKNTIKMLKRMISL